MSKNWNTYYFLFLKFKGHFDTAVYLLKLFTPNYRRKLLLQYNYQNNKKSIMFNNNQLIAVHKQQIAFLNIDFI